MYRRARAVALALLLVWTSACGLEQADPDSRDELADFATTAGELPDGQPYDVYVSLAERNGIRFMEFAAAEQLAATLCAGGELDPDPSAWSAHDTAMVRAYCPELETGG